MAKKDIFSRAWKYSMHRITRRMNNDPSKLKPIDRAAIKKILIIRPNHRLGNMLLTTPFVKEVISVFPSAEIDLFVKGNTARLIFENYAPIKRIYSLPKKGLEHLPSYLAVWFKTSAKKYDLVLNGYTNSSSGRIATKIANANYRFFGDEFEDLIATRQGIKHIARSPVLILRQYFKKCGIKTDLDAPVPLMELKLNAAEREQGKNTLRKLTGNDKKTICLFTFATGDKCLPSSWWEPFFQELKKKAVDYNIIEILNYEKISRINHAALSFYSQNIREMAAVMAASALFIGTDSGIMHLASASLIPTIGIFSVTDGRKFGPYGGKNKAVQVTPENYRPCMEVVEKVL